MSLSLRSSAELIVKLANSHWGLAENFREALRQVGVATLQFLDVQEGAPVQRDSGHTNSPAEFKSFVAASLADDIRLAESVGDKVIDERLVGYSTLAMRYQLEQERQEGRTGWYKAECSTNMLKAQLAEQAAKGNMVNVMNLAAKIYAKEALIDCSEVTIGT